MFPDENLTNYPEYLFVLAPDLADSQDSLPRPAVLPKSAYNPYNPPRCTTVPVETIRAYEHYIETLEAQIEIQNELITELQELVETNFLEEEYQSFQLYAGGRRQ